MPTPPLSDDVKNRIECTTILAEHIMRLPPDRRPAAWAKLREAYTNS